MALTVYSTTWCGPCKRLKSQLAREGITFQEVDIERDPAAAEFVMSVNDGNQTVPTVVIDTPNGRIVRTNPSALEVKALLEAA
ncbi:mycoredoxin [Nonomuraea phyllanthi]|uniref:Mycoredoxin n=1 Tax=Nonomuraea phyllanthi TaxID=2219224 RepID=A0A5C4UX99_9ACTN|nr:mycoredoxin [Nonomuraea phyllanthi]KAB8183309.1 mycoredoxin [Nonomuraea phyllanthi]QFY12622.1 mycoredoxin [Nonomuraea phyllanthi]